MRINKLTLGIMTCRPAKTILICSSGLTRGIPSPDRIVTETVHPEFTGVISATGPYIIPAERDFIIHTVINENFIGLPDADKGCMGNLPIVTRDVGMPFLCQVSETAVDIIQARTSADTQHCGSFRNTHGRSGSHQRSRPVMTFRYILPP